MEFAGATKRRELTTRCGQRLPSAEARRPGYEASACFQSRLTTSILRRPPYLALTRIERVIDLRDEAHRSNERKGADVSVRKGLVQAGRRGKDGATFRNDIVDENELHGLERKPRGDCARGDCEGVIVLADSWTIGSEGRRRLADRKASLDTCPNRISQSNFMQRESQSFGRPRFVRGGHAAWHRDQYGRACE